MYWIKQLQDPKETWVQVYKGVWQDRMIAIKVCRQEHTSARAMKQFQTEVAILNGCSHKNVVEFIGACCWKVRHAALNSRLS